MDEAGREDQQIKRRLQLVAELTSSQIDKAAQYDNTVLGLGYVAFFALWSGMKEHLEPWITLSTGGLIGVSLIAYLLWNIIQMLGRHGSFGELEKVLVDTDVFDEQFGLKWQDASSRAQRKTVKTMRFWRPLFYISAASGLLGAAGLSTAAVSAAVTDILMKRPAPAVIQTR